MRALVAVLAALLVALLPRVALAAPFDFKVPEGWTRVTKDQVTTSAGGKVPAEMLAQVRATDYAFFASDLRGGYASGFAPNMNVILQRGSERMTQAALDEVADGLPKQIGSMSGGSAIVTDRRLATIGGVTCGRIQYQATLAGRLLGEVLYLIPGDKEIAIVTYTSAREDFDRLAPTFDESAMATTGAAQPSRLGAFFSSMAGRVVIFAAIGGLLGGVAALVARLRRKA